jgi:hypothetical protein
MGYKLDVHGLRDVFFLTPYLLVIFVFDTYDSVTLVSHGIFESVKDLI